MKNNIKKYLFFTLMFGFLLVNSCNVQKNKEVNYLDEWVDELDMGSNIEWIVVLPGLGCHGCIIEGEAFMKEYVENEEILFVLTKAESIKLLQNKLDLKLGDYNNIMIDRDNKFSIPSDNIIYPCIIKVKEGAMEEYQFQSPSNSMAFEKLKAQI